MTTLAPDPVATPDEVEPELLIREARRRQRRRRLAVLAVAAAAALAGFLATRGPGAAPRPESLLARALHFPSLGSGGRCPVSSGSSVDNAYFGGVALGRGPVRVLLGGGDIARGRVELGARGASGWFALQTLWFATPGYDGPFVVRAARLGTKGSIEVQSGGSGDSAGQVPGSGPLVVPAGPTINTFYTNWRVGYRRDAVTGRLVRTLTGYGYRTVPAGTWIKSAGCYGWQVDGRGFSETIVIHAL